MPAATPLPATEPTWLVACLCAAWCQTCGSYQATFDALADAHPDVRFAWVDIEDHADALESEAHEAPDIVNFPTLLVLRGDVPRFFGTVLPHANVLERMVSPATREALPQLRDAQTVALGAAVRALALSQPDLLRPASD